MIVISQLIAGVHTLTIKTPNRPNITKDKRVLSVLSNTPSAMEELTEEAPFYKLKMNPNKYFAHDYYINSYSQFEKAFNIILDGLDITDYIIVRVDFRIDSDDPFFYTTYNKIVALFISMFRTGYKDKNVKKTIDLDNPFLSSSLYLKNDYFEIIFYDKGQQTNYKDKTLARIELRTKKNTTNDLQSIIDKWIKKTSRVTGLYENTLARINNTLITQYKDRIKDSGISEKQFLYNFICLCQNQFYTAKQLKQFLIAIGNTPERAIYLSKKYKRAFKIEYVPFRAVEGLCNEINKALLTFIGS